MLKRYRDNINKENCHNLIIDIDERCTESDSHIIFEALHILTENNPERLYSILHAKGRLDHPEANAGKTFLMIKKISDSGAQICQ
jgi:hypothetical protein